MVGGQLVAAGDPVPDGVVVGLDPLYDDDAGGRRLERLPAGRGVEGVVEEHHMGTAVVPDFRRM